MEEITEAASTLVTSADLTVQTFRIDEQHGKDRKRHQNTQEVSGQDVSKVLDIQENQSYKEFCKEYYLNLDSW